MKKIFKIILIFFLVIFILVLLTLGYLGFVPGLSTLLGTDKPRDLGIKHTEQDLKRAQEKLGQKIIAASDQSSYDQLKAAPGNPVDITMTEAEMSAHGEKLHPVSNLQIKFTGDSFEASGVIDKSRLPQFLRFWGLTGVSDAEIIEAVNTYLPGSPVFYIKGTGSITDNDVAIAIDRAELGRLPIPADSATQFMEQYGEMFFEQVPSFSAQTMKVENGQLHFKGTAIKEVPGY